MMSGHDGTSIEGKDKSASILTAKDVLETFPHVFARSVMGGKSVMQFRMTTVPSRPYLKLGFLKSAEKPEATVFITNVRTGSRISMSLAEWRALARFVTHAEESAVEVDIRHD